MSIFDEAPPELKDELDKVRPLPPRTTEDELALLFAESHAADLRYVALWGKWYRWDGACWLDDDTLHAFDLVRCLCRKNRKSLPADAPKTLHAILASAKTVAAIERMAKSDRRLAATKDQWDRDLMALNTQAGIVALHTGLLLPHDAYAYCTKITAVAPAPAGAPCPLWMAFLRRVMDGDEELIRFLQRVAGYCLTGSVSEHALFFGYGTGANGKGTFLNTLTAIMGGYAAVAAMETFTESRNERHPTDLAMLRGARMVAAQETEEGRLWAESRIKALTGGDPITARFMRQDFFTYTPQFKLLIAGNHKPSLRGVDEAIRRRLHLIPFKVTIPDAERDQDLAEKLKHEWPAILRWAIDGCLEWQRIGLSPPKAVRSATDDYLASEDAFALWFEECCRKLPGVRENTADLFASWRGWAERTGEHAGSRKRFSQTMEARGFVKRREGGTGREGFDGVSILRNDYTDDPRCGP